MSNRNLGIAIIGLGGAVGSTMAAGIELLKKGKIDRAGLPLADLDENLVKDLAAYENITFAGWDLFGEHLAKAAEEHEVLTLKQFAAVEQELRRIKPWRATANKEFLANIEGENTVSNNSHRETVEKIRANLREFKQTCDSAVVINLASTEKLADEGNEIFNSLADFEKALDANAKEISPAMLYAYAAIAENVPYGNFTPSVSADIPALIEFAETKGVPMLERTEKRDRR